MSLTAEELFAELMNAEPTPQGLLDVLDRPVAPQAPTAEVMDQTSPHSSKDRVKTVSYATDRFVVSPLAGASPGEGNAT